MRNLTSHDFPSLMEGESQEGILFLLLLLLSSIIIIIDELHCFLDYCILYLILTCNIKEHFVAIRN